MQSVKNNTSEYICKTDSQTQKTNLWLPKGEVGGGRQVRDMALTDTTITYKTDKQKGYTTVQHRELYPLSCNNL